MTENRCDTCQRRIPPLDGGLCARCINELHDERDKGMVGMTLTEYPNIEQGTDAWHDVRRGIVTASVVGKLVSVGPPDALTVGCEACSAPPLQPCISTARKVPTPIKTLHDARTQKAATLPPVYSVATGDVASGIVATLAAERISGWTEETPIYFDMRRGHDLEAIGPRGLRRPARHRGRDARLLPARRGRVDARLQHPMASWVTTGCLRSSAREQRRTYSPPSLTRCPLTT